MSSATMPVPVTATAPLRSAADLRRRRIWALFLLVGFWMARPYYFPWTAEQERSADTRAMENEGNWQRQVSMPVLGLLAAYMLYSTRQRYSRAERVLRGERGLAEQEKPRRFSGRLAMVTAAYCTMCWLSVAWSGDPALTLKRLVVFSLDILLVIALAKVFSAIELAELGFYLCGTVAVVAFVCDAFITRSFAPFDPDYRFIGVMSSNSQGQNLTACIFCGLAVMLRFPRYTKWFAPFIGAMMVLLYLTRSRTATFTCLLLSLFFIKKKMDASFRPQTLLIVTLLGIGTVGPMLIVSGQNSNLALNTFMLGREDTQNTASLSNRAPLWAELSDYIARRPLLGYGYNSFWTVETVALISAHQGWGVPNGHNTFIDQVLSVGFVGFALYATVFVGSLIRAWGRYRRSRSPEALLGAVLLSWLFLTSLLEAVPLDPFLPTFLAYVFLAKGLMPEGTDVDGGGFLTPAAGQLMRPAALQA